MFQQLLIYIFLWYIAKKISLGLFNNVNAGKV